MSRIMNHPDYPDIDEGKSVWDTQDDIIEAAETHSISLEQDADPGYSVLVNVVSPKKYDETDREKADEEFDRFLDEAFEDTYDPR